METQSCCDGGPSMQAGKCTAGNGFMESLCYPAVPRAAGIRDAWGSESPVMPGPWKRLAQNLAGQNLPGRFPDPSASVCGRN